MNFYTTPAFQQCTCYHFLILGGHIFFLTTREIFTTEELYQQCIERIKHLEDQGIWKSIIHKEHPEIVIYEGFTSVIFAMKVLK